MARTTKKKPARKGAAKKSVATKVAVRQVSDTLIGATKAYVDHELDLLREQVGAAHVRISSVGVLLDQRADDFEFRLLRFGFAKEIAPELVRQGITDPETVAEQSFIYANALMTEGLKAIALMSAPAPQDTTTAAEGEDASLDGDITDDIEDRIE